MQLPMDSSTDRSSQRQPSMVFQPAVTERNHTKPALAFRRAASQRLATAAGAIIAALACTVALPAHAQAATTAWSTQAPTGPCGAPKSISTGYGYAKIKACMHRAQSASGTWYYNGVLQVKYRRLTGYVGDVLGGKSMIARAGRKHALGVNDCPRKRWISDQTLWCYSPTKTGQRIYGKGVLLDHAGRWYPPVRLRPQLRYVALGDSYAAGESLGNYIHDGTRCHRSRRAYGFRLSLAAHLDRTVRACSGATTAGVRQNQVSWLDGGTDLVTVQVGGNDIRVVDLFLRCVVKDDCSGALKRARQTAAAVLVVAPASCLSHVLSTLPVYVQLNGWAVRL